MFQDTDVSKILEDKLLSIKLKLKCFLVGPKLKRDGLNKPFYLVFGMILFYLSNEVNLVSSSV